MGWGWVDGIWCWLAGDVEGGVVAGVGGGWRGGCDDLWDIQRQVTEQQHANVDCKSNAWNNCQAPYEDAYNAPSLPLPCIIYTGGKNLCTVCVCRTIKIKQKSATGRCYPSDINFNLHSFHLVFLSHTVYCSKNKYKRTGHKIFCFLFFFHLEPNHWWQHFMLTLKMFLKVICFWGQLQERQIANHYSKQTVFVNTRHWQIKLF
jgi:hypothetical protein